MLFSLLFWYHNFESACFDVVGSRCCHSRLAAFLKCFLSCSFADTLFVGQIHCQPSCMLWFFMFQGAVIPDRLHACTGSFMFFPHALYAGQIMHCMQVKFRLRYINSMMVSLLTCVNYGCWCFCHGLQNMAWWISMWPQVLKVEWQLGGVRPCHYQHSNIGQSVGLFLGNLYLP